MSNITIIGSTNVDLIMHVPCLPRIGESVLGCSYQQVFGGKGANTAVATVRAGGAATFVGCVGDDAFGIAMKTALSEESLEVCGVQIVPDTASGTALIMFDQNGDNYLAVAAGANSSVTTAYIDAHREDIAGAEWLLLQMEIPPAANRRACEIATECDTRVLLNYAPAGPAFELGPEITILIVNKVEAEALSGINCDTINKAAVAGAELLKSGPETVIVTLGDAGAIVTGSQGEFHVPAFAAEAVDTTAAGDTFCGSLGVALAEQRPLKEAVRFASAAAALSVTRVGAQPSIPRRTEIEALINKV